MSKTPVILFTIFLAIACSLQLHAQPGNKSTATGSRLIALTQSQYINDTFRLTDTASYMYNGSRGYDAHTGGWKYDTGITQSRNITTNIYTNYSNELQSFDAANNDTTYILQNWSGSWVNGPKKTYHYNSANCPDTITSRLWSTSTSTWNNNSKNTLMYNTSNQLVEKIYQGWNAVADTWQNNSVTYVYYNSLGDTSSLSSFNWNTSTSVYDTFVRMVYAYDGSRNILSKTYQMWNPTTFWNNSAIYIDSGFVNRQPLLQYYMYWNPTTSMYDTTSLGRYTYNADNQVQTVTSESNFTGIGWQYRQYYHYYYQAYTSGVAVIGAGSMTANIYPVPASDAWSIDIYWNEPQPFTISLLDMQGRIVNSWRVPATDKYHATYPARDIPAGNYLVKIKGITNEITKQLVITH